MESYWQMIGKQTNQLINECFNKDKTLSTKIYGVNTLKHRNNYRAATLLPCDGSGTIVHGKDRKNVRC